MMKNYLLVSILLLVTSSVHTQDFTIMSLKGKVECRPGTGKTTAAWHVAATGDRLDAKDQLRTSYASYVKVLHRDGRLLSIDENSSVTLGTLLGSNTSGSARTSTASLLRYAAEKMRGSKQEASRANVFGAVRATLDYFTPALPAGVVLPAVPHFRWIDTDTSQLYTLFMYDSELNVCYQGVIAGREAMWPSAVSIPEHGGLFYWRLRRDSDRSVTPPRRIVVLPRDSASVVTEELERLNTELLAMNADDAMRHLIRATYLEQKQLYSNAFTEYELCLRADPDTQEYRDLATAMLEQLQLLEESYYLMEE